MIYWKISAERGSISPENHEINISVMGKPMYISKSLITSRMKEASPLKIMKSTSR